MKRLIFVEMFALMIHHDQNLGSNLVNFDRNLTQIPSMLKISMETLHVIFVIIPSFMLSYFYAGLKYKDV